MIDIAVFSVLIKAVLVITVVLGGLLLVVSSTRIKHNVPALLFFFYVLGVLAWTFGVLVTLSRESVFAAQLSFASALMLATAKYYFVLTFPEGKMPRSRFMYVPLIFASLVFLLSFKTGAFFESFTVVDGAYIVVENGPYAGVYMLTIIYLLVQPMVLLSKKHKSGKYSPIEHEQIRYMFYGILFAFIVGMLANSILPVAFSIYYFNGLGPSVAFVLICMVFFIMSKHRFLGFRLVLQRGIIYSVLILCISALYILVLCTVAKFFGKSTEVSAVISSIVTTSVGIFIAPALTAFFRKITDPLFFKETYDYTTALETLSAVLDSAIAIEDIIPRTESALQNVLRAREVRITIGEPDSQALTSAVVRVPIMRDQEKNRVYYAQRETFW